MKEYEGIDSVQGLQNAELDENWHRRLNSDLSFRGM